MSNPKGINQYSGGGKGARQITVMSARTGRPMTSTRDAAAAQLHTLRSMKGLVSGKQKQSAINAQLGNYRAAAKRQAKR